MDPLAVVQARSQGINRTTSMNHLKQHLGTFDHCAILQGFMQQDTSTKYHPGCVYAKGMCQTDDANPTTEQGLLHKQFILTIRDQIERNLPPSQAREYIGSGDVVIAIRCGPAPSTSKAASSSSSSEPRGNDVKCNIFMLAHLCLRPACGVLAAMSVKSVSKSDPVKQQAQFLLDDTGCFCFKTSWELVADLLALRKTMDDSIIYLNVLVHNPLHPAMH